MKSLFVSLLAIISCTVYGQNISNVINENLRFLEDLNGNPISLRSEYEFDGSPYFNDSFCTAVIKVARGKAYQGLQAKLNLQENKLIYRLANGQELEATTPLEYISFSGCNGNAGPVLFRSGYPNIDRQTATSYYQVLDSGRTQLLKYWKVTYIDQKPYGTASIIRKFDNFIVYYAYSPESGMIRLGKAGDISTGSFGQKKADLDRYISSQNLRLKKEEDLKKLFAYYNTLAQ